MRGLLRSMIFLSYDFAIFALVFFGAYRLCAKSRDQATIDHSRRHCFPAFYGGMASLIPVLLLTVATYYAGRSGNRVLVTAAIALCVTTLLFYKYTVFLAENLITSIIPGMAAEPIVRLDPPGRNTVGD